MNDEDPMDPIGTPDDLGDVATEDRSALLATPDVLRIKPSQTESHLVEQAKAKTARSFWTCSLCSYSKNTRSQLCKICASPRHSLFGETKDDVSDGNSSDHINDVDDASGASGSSIIDQFRSTTDSIKSILEELASLETSGCRTLNPSDAEAALPQDLGLQEHKADEDKPLLETKREVADTSVALDTSVVDKDTATFDAAHERRREERRSARRTARNKNAPVLTVVLGSDDEEVSQVTEAIATPTGSVTNDRPQMRTNYEELFLKLQQELFEAEDEELRGDDEQLSSLGTPVSDSKRKAAPESAILFTDDDDDDDDDDHDNIDDYSLGKSFLGDDDMDDPVDMMHRRQTKTVMAVAGDIETGEQPALPPIILIPTKRELRQARYKRQNRQLMICIGLAVMLLLVGIAAVVVVLR